MSGIQQAVLSTFISTELKIGDPFQGGYFAGQISTAGTGVADYNLVIAPSSGGQVNAVWKNANTATSGADSDVNGAQNTADMVADGNSTVYPGAHFCNDLVLGGYSDWYAPAKNELEILYYNLKPAVSDNVTTTGANPNAVPARASNYTLTVPGQTSATIFKQGNSEAIITSFLWSSTEVSDTNASTKWFAYGGLYSSLKTEERRFRAIRKVAV